MHTRTRQNGFTLVELLLAVAILAMLLAAVAAGVHASLTSYAENEKIAALNQTSMSILNRMVHDVRTAAAVDVAFYTITIIPPTNAEGLEEIEYSYDGATLWYRRKVNGTTTSHVLLGPSDDVQVGVFYAVAETGLDWEGTPCTKSVAIRLELSLDDRVVATTVSAAPRRNQDY